MLPKSSDHPPLQHLPSKSTLLLAMLFSMLFLLWSSGSNHLLDSSFTYIVAPPTVPSQLGIVGDFFPPSSKDAKKLAVDWMRPPSVSNFSQKLLQTLADNGTKPCHEVSTARTRLFGLPVTENGDPVRLRCGLIHEVILVSYDDSRQQRCIGGDYFETDLSGPGWKSRPPIKDLGNGSYSIRLQVHCRFAGVYDFRVILLFSNFHGLHRRPERWFRDEEMLKVQIEFQPNDSVLREMPGSFDAQLAVVRNVDVSAPRLRECGAEDFKRQAWTGRWTQVKASSDCSMNSEGRFICLDLDKQCESPWCEGSLGALESNGWVYSAHCAFRIYGEESAWRCLDKKWIFFGGDSNHVDTIRNLLNFVLGYSNVTEVPRRFDQTFFRTLNASQSVRITSMFNGHSNVSLNHQGLFSLSDPLFREQIRQYFSVDAMPDVVIMNSGLHDGMYWKHVHQFLEQGVDEAVKFWLSVLKPTEAQKQPRVIYRTTIATAAWARSAAFNPHKMEVFNHMFVERLARARLLSQVVDDFDLTFPWHYDNNCSDGVHYGKPPARRRWYGQMGHQYFVDLMLIHILLHAICER